MALIALLSVIGLGSGFLLIWRVPVCRGVVAGEIPGVSIIIPARNEERNLPRLLHSVSAAAAPNAEVIVVDDGSTDKTAALAAQLGARVITPAPKPEGWTGKAWACDQGARSATRELLLFLDADTYFEPGGLHRLLASWQGEKDSALVLSVLPYHAMEEAYEQLSLFFNLLMAAGAGGFGVSGKPRLFGQSLLMATQLYFSAGGHAAVRGSILENLRWAGLLRRRGARIRCLGGKGTLSMRMFPEGHAQMTESWSKAFVQGAADSGPVVLLSSIAWISALWTTTLLLLMPHDYGRVSLAVLYLLFAAQIIWLSRSLGNFRLLGCLFFPIPLFYYCVVFARSAWRRALGRKSQWRGREV